MTKLPAQGRAGDPPAWPLPPDLRTATLLEAAHDAREVAEAQSGAVNPPPGIHGKLARLDQRIAVLEARQAASARLEAVLWAELWSTPQAVAWERTGWIRDVAGYVRWKVAAELGDLDAAREARQIGDRLGLTPLAMLRLRWEVAPDEVGEARGDVPADAGRVPRRRLKVVDPDAVAGG